MWRLTYDVFLRDCVAALAMTTCLLTIFSVSVHAKDYWEGSQLNNQARLGQPFDGFEVADPSKKSTSRWTVIPPRYMGRVPGKVLVIHGMLIDLSGVDQFLTVSRLDTGGKLFTIRLNVLFNENTAEYKAGSLQLLDRLNTLLKAYAKDPIQLKFVDDAGVFPGVENCTLNARPLFCLILR